MSDAISVRLMERVRLQTEALVPLLRHLHSELGDEAANGLVYPALCSCMKNGMAELSVPAVTLSRSGTIMTGAPRCPFVYRFQNDDTEA
jgi:hypothetical protein